MLDELLGRSELKAEISALETERDELEAELEQREESLERERERRKAAVTDRQEAQRRVNQLEDRIEQLEDQRDRLRADETTLEMRRTARLQGRRLAEILSRLESVETESEAALTAYVGDGHDLPDAIRDGFGERASLVSRAAPCLAMTDDASLVSVCLSPPVAPDPFVEWSDGFTFERDWLQPRGGYTLALVRSDLFAMGSYQGDERTAFHGFDSELKSQHSKGGFSQARFERLRDEQIDNHVERSLAALEERERETLYVVGERSILGEFMHLADATAAVDATGDPEAALQDAWQDFWTVQLHAI